MKPNDCIAKWLYVSGEQYLSSLETRTMYCADKLFPEQLLYHWEDVWNVHSYFEDYYIVSILLL